MSAPIFYGFMGLASLGFLASATTQNNSVLAVQPAWTSPDPQIAVPARSEFNGAVNYHGVKMHNEMGSIPLNKIGSQLKAVALNLGTDKSFAVNGYKNPGTRWQENPVDLKTAEHLHGYVTMGTTHLQSWDPRGEKPTPEVTSVGPKGQVQPGPFGGMGISNYFDVFNTRKRMIYSD